MKSKEEIVALAQNIKATAGIYYLLRGEEIVYIGKSQNAYGRVVVKGHDHEFDKFYVENVEPDKLDAIVVEEIIKYRPRFNIGLPENSIYATLKQLKTRFNAPILQIRKVVRYRGLVPILVGEQIYYKITDFAPVATSVPNTDKIKEGDLW